MSDLWYYLDANHEVCGPLDLANLVDVLRKSQTGPNTLVWREGMAGWEAAGTRSDIAKVVGPPPPRPGTLAAQRGDALVATADLRLAQAVDEDAEVLSAGDSAQTHPWRRFFARHIDMILAGMLGGFIIGVMTLGARTSLWHKVLNNDIVFGMLMVLVMMLLEAVLIATFGGTVGKAVYGIELRSEDGAPIGFGQSFRRAFKVYLRGMAIGFPLIFLVAAYFGYKALKEEGRTSWDAEEKIVVHHRPIGAVRVTIITLVWVGLLTVIILGVAAKRGGL